jgi:endonuclease/exonuclease/phosphatase family metal-dependent hydrolase
MLKTLTIMISLACLGLAGFWLYAFSSAYIPNPIEAVRIECSQDTPNIPEQKPLSVMSYNVQFMAGRNYVFYYDLPNMSGPDAKPSREDVNLTLSRIAQLIKQASPDVLLLQEMHQGHVATEGRDQVAELQKALGGLYPCLARADYWRAGFIPHPKIMGPVGLELVTLSKYKIQDGSRYQLPQTPRSWLKGPFHLQRAILEVDLTTDLNRPIKVLNTHFEAFPNGSDVSAKQVEYSLKLLKGYSAAGIPWFFGGDLNLLPYQQYENVPKDEQPLYNPASEIHPLMATYSSVPSQQALSSNTAEQWFTYSPNRFESLAPDRTLDYVFYSNDWRLLDAKVQTDQAAQQASDHMPVSAVFQLQPTEIQ